MSYGNKRQLVNAHMADFYSAKAVKADISLELKRLIKQPFNPIHALVSLAIPGDLRGHHIVFVAVSLLETSVQKDWNK